jgi:large subunit ribosomal protein L6
MSGEVQICKFLMDITGKMSMTIPTFVNLEHDMAARNAFVTVQDKEIQKQREMWGMKSVALQ